MNIFVGNLSFDAKEIDVQRVFMAFGVVTSVVIVMEKKGKKSRGFGFVEMPDEQEALAAIMALNGKEILGRPINVLAALEKKPKKDFPKVENKPGQEYKRTGKYREGRRTINYLKKRLDAGLTAAAPEHRYKSNPLRWRKKPRTEAYVAKPVGEPKPWQRPQTESNPWKKPWVKSNAWRKPEGEPKPWQKSQSESRAKPQAASRPWKKTASQAKPWRKSSDSRAQSNFKTRKSPVSHKK